MKNLFVKIFLCILLVSYTQEVYTQNSVFVEQASMIQKIQGKGEIVVAMVATEQFPFLFEGADGELAGLDVDIANELAKALDVKLTIDRSAPSFNDLIPLVEQGIADVVVSKLSRTTERAQRVLFSNPYVVFRQSFLLNRLQLARVATNDKQVNNLLKNFSGRLGVIADSSYERFANENFQDADIISFPTWQEAIDAVIAGDVFGIYRDELEITKVIADNPEYNLYVKPVVIDDYKDYIAIAMPKIDSHFRFFVNLVLASVQVPTDIRKFLEKYRDYEE